jgi:hypothetical protein
MLDNFFPREIKFLYSIFYNVQRKNTWDCKFEVCSLLKYLKIVTIDKPVSIY